MRTKLKKLLVAMAVGVLLVSVLGTKSVEAASSFFENHFPLPVDGTVSYGVTVLRNYSWGDRHSTYLYTYGPLKGETEDLNIVADIAAPKGTFIYAVADGTIYTNAYADKSGNYVVIQHDDGTYSYYGHMLSKSSYSVGTKVSAGTIIGCVGMTGASSGYHLHFEWSGHDPYCEYSSLGYIYTVPKSGAEVYPHDHSSASSPVEWSNLYHANVTENTAYLSVDIRKTGALSKVGYYLGTSESNMSQICSWSVGNILTFCTCQIGGAGNEANITLQPNTTYYYRAFVTDAYDNNWYSETKSFTTSSCYTGSPSAPSTVHDTTKPVISDVQIIEADSEGYTIACTVTDDNEIVSVIFPTYTIYNWDDDITLPWPQQTSKSGSTYYYRVRYADHNYEEGIYRTNIHAYDSANCAIAVVEVDVTLY